MLSGWPVYDRVLVNLTDGTAIDGLLVGKPRGLLILADATLHTPGHEPAALDGDVYVTREKVLFLQTRKE